MSGKNRTLYIIGNGFDICHKLDTSTERFREILRAKDIYNEIENAEVIFEKYNVIWGDYESCLADIDLEAIGNEQIIAPDYYSDHEYDRDGGIYNMEEYTKSLYYAIQESLETMVDNANQELKDRTPIFREFLNSEDAVVSFNYTSTLETLYNIPNDVSVCHIHGYREKRECLLLGFRDGMSLEEYTRDFFDECTIKEVQKKIEYIQEDDILSEKEKEDELMYWHTYYDELTKDIDYYIDTQRNVIYLFYQSLKKEMQFEKLRKFLYGCKGITRVVVMGHSMSMVDSDYMEMIESTICPKVWEISQYENSPSKEILNGYSFTKKIKCYDLYEKYKR